MAKHIIAYVGESQPEDDRRQGGLVGFLSTKPAGELMSRYDLDQTLRDMFESVQNASPETVRFDGLFAADEPDHDDTPIAVGDRVRVSYVGCLGMPEEFRPFYYGTVRSVEPWHEKQAGMVFVSLDHAKRPEHGAWWERERISKMVK